MEIYFVLLTMIIILSVLPTKMYAVLVTVLMGGIAAIRDVSVGTDTAMYNGIYNGVNEASFEWTYYDKTLTEIGDRFFMVLAKNIFDMPQGYIILSSAITFICFCLFFYKETDKKYFWVVIFCFIALQYYAICLNTLRQVLAISIGIFFYMYAKNNKYICAFLSILIGALFHLSVVVYIPVLIYYIVIKKIKKLDIKWINVCSLIFSVIESLVIYIGYRIFMSSPEILGDKYILYAYNSYSDSSDQGVSVITIAIMICIIITIMRQFFKHDIIKDNTLLIMLSLQYVLFAFATSYIMSIIFRVMILFYPFIFMLIAEFIENTQNKYLRPIFIICLIVFGYINLYYHIPDDVVPYNVFF